MKWYKNNNGEINSLKYLHIKLHISKLPTGQDRNNKDNKNYNFLPTSDRI